MKNKKGGLVLMIHCYSDEAELAFSYTFQKAPFSGVSYQFRVYAVTVLVCFVTKIFPYNVNIQLISLTSLICSQVSKSVYAVSSWL